MRTSFGLATLMTGLLALGLCACGETERGKPSPFTAQSGSSSGGQPAGSAGAAAGGNTTGGELAGAASAIAGSSTTAGGDATPTPMNAPITQVVKSAACDVAFPNQPAMKSTLQTQGVKAPDCAAHLSGGEPVCGEWSAPRDYYVYLPLNYDIKKAYPLVIEAPGCGGNGTNIYPLESNPAVIRVGITPGPQSLGHGTNPDQGCFDDKEGDDSIDWVFYERLYDRLNQEVCFDRNRLFVGGNSNGAWLANELGCKYAGDAVRPVRGVLPRGGGFPTDPRHLPTCSNAPLAGFWVHQVADPYAPFELAKTAIGRAMSVDHCPDGSSYDTASSVDFPIGGGNPADTCKLLSRCDPLYPLVVCALPGVGRGGNDNIVNPGWSTFIRLFQTPEFQTE